MRSEKVSIVAEMRAQMTGSTFLILSKYKGMKVAQAKELRKRLVKQKSEFHVVKNSYLKKAAADLPGFQITEDVDIPLAMVVGKGDGIEAAKILDTFARETSVGSIAFGFFGGRRFSAAEFGELVKLPSRTTLLGMLAGALAAPMSGLASVMRQKVASVVYALQAIQELKSKSNSK
jgi:large subunit ribosomal protein L10